MRVKVPDETVSFTDHIMGAYHQNLAQACGDFILRRSDGVFAYQLAVVVDDALMGVNQVVRGVDLLSSSTPRQIWLQQQLGFPQPEYGHVPLLYGADGHRLSKRQKDVDLGALRQMGKRPEDIVGQLACWAGLIDQRAGAGTEAGGGVRLGESETRECRSGVKRCGEVKRRSVKNLPVASFSVRPCLFYRHGTLGSLNDERKPAPPCPTYRTPNLLNYP